MRRILTVSQLTATIMMTALTASVGINGNSKAIAYGVCGTKNETASFQTQSYLITICPGEASLQLILTYHDGTGYKRIPAQKDGKKYRGTDGNNVYIIDREAFIIGIDGKEPIRQRVIQWR